MSDSIWLHGSAFGENFGDVLLLDIYKEVVKGAGYRAGFPFAWPETLTKLQAPRGILDRPKRVLFCGGGYFGEPPNEISSWNRRFKLRHYPAIFSAHRVGKQAPLAVGVGYGPITDRGIKNKVVGLLSDCEVCLFRDEQSMDLFHRDGGTRSSSVDLSTDMVVTIHGNVYSKPKDFPNTKKEIVIIHLVNKFSDPTDFEKMYAAVTRFVRERKEEIFALIVTDGKGRGGKLTAQDKVAKALEQTFLEIGVEYSKKRYVSHWDLVGTIGNSDYVITNKLHVGIVASVLGRKVCSIPYHTKTVRFYSQIEESHRCLVEAANGDIIFDHIVKCSDEFKASEIPKQIQTLAKKNIDAILTM